MAKLTFKDLYLDSKRFPKAGDEPFEVPKMILSKPQYLFGFHVVVLYENDEEARAELCEAYDVTNQALWNWRKEGLPYGRAERTKELIADPKIKLRLATNVELEQLVRPVADRKLIRPNAKPHKKWLDLLSKIETGEFEGLSRKNIPDLVVGAKTSGVPLSPWTPYKWGWNNEGVPPSYANSVWKAMIKMDFPERMGMSEERFVDYCNKHFRAITNIRAPGAKKSGGPKIK